MGHNDWPRLAGLASFSLLAVGCAAFLMASGDIAKSVMGAGLLLLAVGQIVFMLAGWFRLSHLIERQAMQGKALRDMAGTTKALTERLQEMETRLDREPEAAPPPAPLPVQESPSAAALAEMQALRQQLRSLADEIQKPYQQPVTPAPAPEPVAAPSKTPPERLDLLLEPMIELATGETAHYRAQLHMLSEVGDEIGHNELMRRAQQSGARPRLDTHLLESSLPVLRRLRGKNSNTRLFVPVGAATLTSATDLRQIIDLLNEYRDVAPGVVLDIIHADLAALGNTGVEGLAQLARLGASMSLSRVSLNGLDLLSLRQLGVRYLDIDARTIDAGFGVAPSWIDFAKYARSMQFQIIGGMVETSAQSQAASRLARYGYGPYFAPPRRVKPGAGETQPGSRFQAA